MVGRRLQKAIIYLNMYGHSRRRTICISASLFGVFIILSLCQIHYIRSQLDTFSSFRMEDYAEQLDEPPETGVEYRYRFSATKGKIFHPDASSVEYLGFPLKDFVSLQTPEELNDFVFLTAASQGFISGLLIAIRSIQQYFPSKTIIVYDLGLASESRQKILLLRNVKVKAFLYENYPPHVKDLFTYAFKPIIIHETLRVHPGVFWVDASVRMTSSNMSAVFKQLQSTRGILLFRDTGHSNFAVTHGLMYSYLPTSIDRMKIIQQREANSILVYRTRDVYTNIIQWWTLCALERKCISPISNRWCHVTSWDIYANCHRFDQSAINILLANFVEFKDDLYILHVQKEILTLKRNIEQMDGSEYVT